jgi:H/ACA ribonucleoprotein complex subunit 4
MDHKLPFEKYSVEFLSKADDFSTDEKIGKSPDKRTIFELLEYGIINLNKPQGPTSHQVSDYIKKILNVEKAGHAGTLDPNVTGCLPVAIGKATRITHSLLIAGKEYICIMHIHEERKKDDIINAINKFIGKIEQLPPLKSAVKREWRTREIYYLDIIEIEEKDVLFKVGCQAGTYIRKLCTDIGKELNCGAHMVELIRTKSGPFKIKESVSLTDLQDAFMFLKEENDESYLRKCILPFERAVDHLKKIIVFDTTIDSICHGAPLNIPGIAKFQKDIKKNELIAVMSLKGELVGVGESKISSDEILKNEKGCIISKMKVFMEPGTYPKFVKT